MELFINAASAISPINSFGNEIPGLIPPDNSLGYFICKEPDYKTIIDKKLLRRMSKFIKMSVANALKCLADAGLEQPDAILTGTSLGCIADTVDFLKQLNQNNETLLNPTAFMQSTHNTASGQIALLLGCKNLNITFSQKNTSFESALLQAEMMLASEDYRNILVGGMDEITPESYQLVMQTNCFSKAKNPCLPGEGAAFFILSNQKSDRCLARFESLTFSSSNISEQIIRDFLHKNGLVVSDCDFAITGLYPTMDEAGVFFNLFKKEQIIWFKNYCGEYDTSTAFALWLALRLLNQTPEETGGISSKKILIHNQGSGPLQSLILVSTC